MKGVPLHGIACGACGYHLVFAYSGERTFTSVPSSVYCCNESCAERGKHYEVPTLELRPLEPKQVA